MKTTSPHSYANWEMNPRRRHCHVWRSFNCYNGELKRHSFTLVNSPTALILICPFYYCSFSFVLSFVLLLLLLRSLLLSTGTDTDWTQASSLCSYSASLAERDVLLFFIYNCLICYFKSLIILILNSQRATCATEWSLIWTVLVSLLSGHCALEPHCGCQYAASVSARLRAWVCVCVRGR